jgi:undecaprenyl-diphosphatase
VRTNLAKPVATSWFLLANGVILLLAEYLRQSTGNHAAGDEEYVDERVSGPASDERLSQIGVGPAIVIGTTQILALGPGISRSGVTMVAGLLRGLSREDAARFAFLLATPVILAAGALKLPDLSGHLGDGIRGQVLFGSVLSGIGAYLAVRFLTRYLDRRSLRPFGVYCLLAGLASLLRFTIG